MQTFTSFMHVQLLIPVKFSMSLKEHSSVMNQKVHLQTHIYLFTVMQRNVDVCELSVLTLTVLCVSNLGQPSNVETVKSAIIAISTLSKLKSLLYHSLSRTCGSAISPILYMMNIPLETHKRDEAFARGSTLAPQQAQAYLQSSGLDLASSVQP